GARGGGYRGVVVVPTAPPRRVAPGLLATPGPTGGRPEIIGKSPARARRARPAAAPLWRNGRAMRRFASPVIAGGPLPFVIHRTRDAVGRAREARAVVPAHPGRRLVLVHVAADPALARVVGGGSANARRHLRPRGGRDDRRPPRVREPRAAPAQDPADHGRAAERLSARRPRLRRDRLAHRRHQLRATPAAIHPTRRREGATGRRPPPQCHRS